MKIDYDDIILFYYECYEPGKLSPYKSGQFTLRQFLYGGKKGMYCDKIDALRTEEYHSAAYNKIKEELPLVWLCGRSDSGYRRLSDITKKYNIFTIDIDRKDNKKLFDENGIEVVKYDMFRQIDSCFCAMLSAGGQGIVLYLLLDDNLNKSNQEQYFKYWEKVFGDAGIKIDDDAKDILTRARFVSYDKNILIRDEVEPFKLPDTFISSYKKKERKKDDVDIANINSSADIAYLDSKRRYLYCYTLKELFGKEQAETLAKKIYDMFYNGTSDKQEAYKHIEASCKNDTSYIDNVIYRELEVLGIVKETKKAISLEENEYLYDKKDDILDFFSFGINMMDSPPGTGKTEFWNQLKRETNYRICVIEPYTSVVEGKYDKDITNIAAGLGNFIDNEAEYTAANYLKFTIGQLKSMNRYDFIVIDESHLIGMQKYRADDVLSFIDALNSYIEKYPDSKIILQTGTPSNEDFFFEIKKKLVIDKKLKKFVQIHYTHSMIYDKTEENDNGVIVDKYKDNVLDVVMHYTKLYRDEGRKVFIYWGTGGIDKMKAFKEAQKKLNSENVAIYHKKNTGSEDMEYITKNKMMGKYDILMTSCYFNVGCDLNDECATAIIIIGNNPYQEDEQTIGRFRKSNNIKVNIIVDDTKIPNVDVSKLLEHEIGKGIILNKTKDFRNKSIINRYSANEYVKLKAYINCSEFYFSNLKRKFDFYKSKGYSLVNEIEYNEEGNYYEILENTEKGLMPMLYLIDNKDDVLRKEIKKRSNNIRQIKNKIYNILLNDPNSIDLYSMLDANIDKPKLNDWIEAILMIKNHYDLKELLNTVDKKIVLKLSKKKMNDLIHLKINIEQNKCDFVEYEIIKKLISIYDNIKDKKLIDVYIILHYCIWCMYYEENNDFTYDIVNRLAYPVFNQWSDKIKNILAVQKEVREYILNFKKVEVIDNNSASYMFLKDVIEIECNLKKIDDITELYKNKWIHKTYYMEFIKRTINFRYGKAKEEAGSLGGKKGGKIGGKIGGKKGRRIKIGGVVYDTVKDAAEKLGITRDGLYKRLKKQAEQKT